MSGVSGVSGVSASMSAHVSAPLPASAIRSILPRSLTGRASSSTTRSGTMYAGRFARSRPVIAVSVAEPVTYNQISPSWTPGFCTAATALTSVSSATTLSISPRSIR